MKREARFLLTASALAVVVLSLARPASAARIDIPNANLWLSWNSCYGTAGAGSNLSYACDGSLDGTPLKLVFSFELPNTYATYHFAQSMFTLRVRTADSSPLPDYWRIQPNNGPWGSCRQALATTHGFTVFGDGIVDADHCASWFSSNFTPAVSGVAQMFPVDATFPDRVKVEAATVPAINSDPNIIGGVDMPAGAKLSGGAMLIDTAANGCAGCQQEMVFEVVSVNLESCCGNDYYVLGSGGGAGSWVSWQGAAPAVPVRNRTWGAIKSTYR